ncbi:MAG: tetratricopeptide repeat protein [bacterium]
MKKIKIIFICIVLLSSNSVCRAITFIDSLQHGKYSVGFKFENRFDYSRSFGIPYSGKNESDFRPVDIFTWYPSEDKFTRRMTFLDYLKYSGIKTNTDEKLNSLINPVPIIQVIKEESLNTTLNFKTHASINVKPAEGSFPLIIFGQGLYFENPAAHFALCELLASHGFVVISTSLRGTNSEVVQLTLSDLESAIRDLEFLISYAMSIPQVDQSKIGLIGFDMGGMAVQILQMRNINIDAVLTLDAGIIFEHFSGLPKSSPSFEIEKLTVPWMLITQAQFINPYRQYLNQSLWELAKYSDRYFVLLDKIEHVNFTSYSLFNIGKGLTNYWAPGALPDPHAYRDICDYSLNFFNATLLNDYDALEFIKKEIPYSNDLQKSITVEIKHRIESPPTVDYLLQSTNGNNLHCMIDRAKKYAEQNPDWKKLDENQLNFLGYRFITAGDYNSAKDIFELNVFLYPESFNVYDSMGEICMLLERKSEAIKYYEKSLELNPENTNAVEMLKQLK